MSRQEIMEMLADWFHVDPDENGEYDINDYDWQSGCSFNGEWLCLAEIVECLETNL